MKTIWVCIISAGFGLTVASGQGFKLEEGNSYALNFAPRTNYDQVSYYRTPGIWISLFFDPLTVQLNERLRIELFYRAEGTPFWFGEANVPSTGPLGFSTPPNVVREWGEGAEWMRITMLSGEATLTDGSQYTIYTNGDWLHNIWFGHSFNRDVVVVPEPKVHYLFFALGCLYSITRKRNWFKAQPRLQG